MARGIKKVMCITTAFCIWSSLKSVLKRYAVSMVTMVLFSMFFLLSLRSQNKTKRMHDDFSSFSSVQRRSFIVDSQICNYLKICEYLENKIFMCMLIHQKTKEKSTERLRTTCFTFTNSPRNHDFLNISQEKK